MNYNLIFYNDNKERVILAHGTIDEMNSLKNYLQKYFTKPIVVEKEK